MTATTLASIGAGAEGQPARRGEGANQSVLVAAGNDYQHVGVAGGLAVSGTVAVTPGAEVTVITIDTKASIGANAVVEANRDVEVRATAKEDVLAIAISVAGSGEVAVAGAVAVLVLDSATYASIGDNATVAAGGNVIVAASDDTDVDLIGGAVGIGLAAAGVGAVGADAGRRSSSVNTSASPPPVVSTTNTSTATRGGEHILVVAGQQGAVEAEGEAEPGVGGSAERFDEAVVAAAAADGVLRTSSGPAANSNVVRR